MSESVAAAFVYVLAAYAGVGLVFAVAFLWRGIDRGCGRARGRGLLPSFDIAGRRRILADVSFPLGTRNCGSSRGEKSSPMIQPLRTIHRWMFVGLALLPPAVLAVGLGARHPRAARGAESALQFGRALKTSAGLWAKHRIQTEVYVEPSGSYITLRPDEDLNQPDLLLYLSGSSAQGSDLPADAQLLGPVQPGRPLRLPLGAHAEGHLILI
jgi:hypothetical protein